MTHPNRAAPVVDPESGAWISRTDAVRDNGTLQTAPTEYVDAMPWVMGPDGAEWIAARDLRSWLHDGDFAARAQAVLQAREDAEWRDHEGTA